MDKISLIVAKYPDNKIAVQAVLPEEAKDMFENCCKANDKAKLQLLLVEIDIKDGQANANVCIKNIPEIKKM